MKILEQTASKLVMQEQIIPRVFLFGFAFVFGGFPLSFPIRLAFDIEEVTTLSCDRVEPTLINCQNSQSKLFGLLPQSSTSFSLRGIKKAGHDLPTVWVSLSTQNKQANVSVFQGGNPTDMGAIATKINQFINSNEPSLTIRRNSLWRWSTLFMLAFPSIFSIPFLATSVFLVLLAFYPRRTFTFDKISQTLTFEYDQTFSLNFLRLMYKLLHLLGKLDDTEAKSHPLKEITGVIVELKEYTDSDGDSRRYYELTLLSETFNYLVMSSSQLEEVKNLANILCQFLEVPLIER